MATNQNSFSSWLRREFLGTNFSPTSLKGVSIRGSAKTQDGLQQGTRLQSKKRGSRVKGSGTSRAKRAVARGPKPTPLDRLYGDEAKKLVAALIDRNPELRRASDQLAMEILGEVDADMTRKDLDSDSLLAYAPDYCENMAVYAIEILAKKSGRLHHHRWKRPEGSQSMLPEWDGLFLRARIGLLS